MGGFRPTTRDSFDSGGRCSMPCCPVPRPQFLERSMNGTRTMSAAPALQIVCCCSPLWAWPPAWGRDYVQSCRRGRAEPPRWRRSTSGFAVAGPTGHVALRWQPRTVSSVGAAILDLIGRIPTVSELRRTSRIAVGRQAAAIDPFTARGRVLSRRICPPLGVAVDDILIGPRAATTAIALVDREGMFRYLQEAFRAEQAL